MKHVKLTLLILMSSSILLYGNVAPRFGLKSDFSYTDLKDNDFSPDSIFSNNTQFYAGFEYISFSFYASVKPAVRIYTTNNFSIEFQNGDFIKRNETSAKITFFFEDIYLSYLGNNFSTYFGKRIFHFGEGFNRQYIFVGSSVINDDFNALYNAEVSIYQNNITHTIGFMPDTESIDKLEAPLYYLGWYSLRYSDSSLGLLGVAEYRYNVRDNDNHVKIGFETSYIFNKGVKIYGNIVYNILFENTLGKSNNNLHQRWTDVKSLVGVNYTWIYDDITIVPALEYFYEESDSFYSLALHASFFDSLLSVTSSFVYSTDDTINLIVIAGININDQFSLDFTYNTPFNTSDEVLNIFELSLEYNY